MKLWVDDLRRPPSPEWVWAESSADAIEALGMLDVVEMSLDHDLGGEDTTRRVVLWLCCNSDRWPPVVHVHTSNPVGRTYLTGMIARYNPHLQSSAGG